MKESGNLFSKKMDSKKVEAALSNVSSCSATLIKIDLVDENPKNEKIFNMAGIDELAAYMNEVGVHEPILVFQKADGRYEIISGHRKFRARKLRGDKSIDAIVKAAPKTEGDRIYQLVFDNIHSRKLGPMDLARAMNEIKNTWIPEQREKGLVSGETKEILAEKFHMSQSKVVRLLRLLNLNQDLQDKVESGKLAVDAALVLTQDENIHLTGLQDFVNDLIDKACAEEEIDDTAVTKATVIKMVNSFKDLQSEKKELPERKEQSPVSKKKFMKASTSFHDMLNAKFDDKFKLEETDIKALKELQSDIDALLSRYT